MAPPRRPVSFDSAQKPQYGLYIVTRESKVKVNSVSCRFCKVFERRKSTKPTKTNCSLQTIQTFKPSFCTEISSLKSRRSVHENKQNTATYLEKRECASPTAKFPTAPQ